jgi:uncharacterized protein
MSNPHIDIPMNSIVDFCVRWKVREFSLFGSVLRDDFRADSDVDVLVSFFNNSGRTLWDLTTMADELETLIGRRVDLVEKEGLRNPFRRRSILATREVLYAA